MHSGKNKVELKILRTQTGHWHSTLNLENITIFCKYKNNMMHRNDFVRIMLHRAFTIFSLNELSAVVCLPKDSYQNIITICWFLNFWHCFNNTEKLDLDCFPLKCVIMYQCGFVKNYRRISLDLSVRLFNFLQTNFVLSKVISSC